MADGAERTGEHGTASAGGPTAVEPPAPGGAGPSEGRRFAGLAIVFLLPALLILGAMVVYPIVFTVLRSLFDRSGDSFVGAENYLQMLESPRTRTAIRNNVIWVVFAPAVVTVLGLIFAVLSERIRWATAFKVIVFMPMAISFLAAGVIFRLVYEEDPRVGVANAAVTSVQDVFTDPAPYPGARPRDTDLLQPEDGEGFRTTEPFAPGDTAQLGLVGFSPRDLPEEAASAAPPPAPGDGVAGAVWLDFALGGGGEQGEIDPSESGMPGITVQAVADGAVVAETVTDAQGQFQLEAVDQPVALRLDGGAFAGASTGVRWLSPALVTPAIIGAYTWIWAGFAMVLIGAGLAAIPREALEAARVDGANEWQVFRRVTVPLLSPVLLVVMVTLVINVLKVFDLVLIIPPGSVQADANVLALEMWRVSFGGNRDQGLGSALGVLLFLLVIPAMLFNIRRFREEN